MGIRKDKKYRMKEQLQVNEATFSAAYVTAIVENTKHLDCDSETKANIKLAFETVYSYVAMDFDIEFPDQQKNAIKKIKKLESILKEFRKAIAKEAKLQNKRAFKVLKDNKITTR